MPKSGLAVRLLILISAMGSARLLVRSFWRLLRPGYPFVDFGRGSGLGLSARGFWLGGRPGYSFDGCGYSSDLAFRSLILVVATA